MRDTFRYGEDLEGWEIEFWANEYEENLHHRNIDDAVEAILDDWGPPSTTKEIEDIGEIEVCGYVRMEVNEDVDKLVLYHMEHLLEGLDEEYNGGDNPTEITDSMKEAAAEFIRKVLAEYVPWNCESVITVTVPAMDWIKKHRPDWLEDDRSRAAPISHT